MRRRRHRPRKYEPRPSGVLIAHHHRDASRTFRHPMATSRTWYRDRRETSVSNALPNWLNRRSWPQVMAKTGSGSPWVGADAAVQVVGQIGEMAVMNLVDPHPVHVDQNVASWKRPIQFDRPDQPLRCLSEASRIGIRSRRRTIGLTERWTAKAWRPSSLAKPRRANCRQSGLGKRGRSSRRSKSGPKAQLSKIIGGPSMHATTSILIAPRVSAG